MSDTQTQENTSLMSVGGQAAAQKAGEFFVTRAVNAMVDGVKKVYGGSQVLLGTAFTRYLENATKRYNQVQTIATGDITRSIIGSDNIYVSIGVRHGKKTIKTDTVDPLLRISNNLLIQGTGGIGKSMMMRYLFLNTANRGEHVPVLLELRKISRQSPGHVSIMDLVYTCMKDFDVELPREQFEFSLRMGKYVFLMDGFDEVKESMAVEAAEQIQQFCSKYPNNPCIITTRPGRDIAPLETFTTVESMPLSKEQAVELARKIWEEDEKTREFCRQLEEKIYDNEKHREFAENPLLLTMMFLTFMRNNSLPDHLAEFYRQAFEALYSTHDSKNKGAYRREFRCDKLDEPGFRLLLSHFCFQSYFQQEFEFSEDRLLQYLQKSINKFGFTEIQEKDFFQDLKKVVCLLIKDGEEYRFAHRSFQTYFAARYTAERLNDEQQKKVLREFVNMSGSFSNRDYLELLDQLEHERMTVNLLEDTIRQRMNEVRVSEYPARSYLKSILPNTVSVEFDLPKGRNYVSVTVWDNDCFIYYEEMFYAYVKRQRVRRGTGTIHNILNKESEVFAKVIANSPHDKTVYVDLDDVVQLGVPLYDLEVLFDKMASKLEIAETISDMCNWLDSIDEQRKKLEEKSFIEDL